MNILWFSIENAKTKKENDLILFLSGMFWGLAIALIIFIITK